MEFYEKALSAVIDNFTEPVTTEAIKLVWFTKTLNNWKAMVADIRPNGYFYEVTYSGEYQDTNIDVYKKINSLRIDD
jgi:hypothetical protein